MADKLHRGKDDQGYVDIGTICDERYPITSAYESVMAHMPETERKIISEQARDVGFGPEPGVIIDESDDRFAGYDD